MSSATRLPAWPALLLAGAFVAAGCAALLGIEEAVCDPDLDPACAGGEDDDGDFPVFTELDELCDAYCEQVTEACTEADGAQQYDTDTACRVVCTRGMVLGEPGDTEVDTAYCRFENSLNVGIFGETEVDCAAAGLGGDGACGPMCEVYCDLLASVCSDVASTADTLIVHDFDACIEECEEVPRTPEPFDFEVASGDSLECRLWHIQAAFGSASTHCPHAAGLGICVP